ncbi:MAG: sigma-54 dependent transcriptional regulator [Thermodesulfobacteriota bacterium]|nr:sigma-54 dependent transcriptional regulator [Thermodesulfobacteriota bacterium]
MAIAILESDPPTLDLVSELIHGMGIKVYAYNNKDSFLETINPRIHSIAIICDEFMDVMEGTKQVYPDIEILAIGDGTMEKATTIGAAHFLKKPFRAQEMKDVLNVLVHVVKDEQSTADTSFIIKDPSMRNILMTLDKAAPTQASILIQGESGTGKEVIARYIHNHSKRASGAYIGINLTAIPEALIESELFGYEKGAFTGAYTSRVGRFEQAHEGTILLDEITEISPGLQAKLLRVLQEKQIDRIGSDTHTPVDFRVIATTNRDIEDLIRQGMFRHDLYYRLNVIRVKVPPLRQRQGDIPALIEHFIQKTSRREGMPHKSLSPGAAKCLLGYEWPGNVRELENVMERAMILSETDTITEKDIMLDTGTQPSSDTTFPSGVTIHEMEKRLIFSTLEKVGNNRTQASELLGISIRTLRNKLNEYNKKSQDSDAPKVKTPVDTVME